MCLFYPGPFHNHWEVEVAIYEWLQMQEPDFYNGGIFKLLP